MATLTVRSFPLTVRELRAAIRNGQLSKTIQSYRYEETGGITDE